MAKLRKKKQKNNLFKIAKRIKDDAEVKFEKLHNNICVQGGELGVHFGPNDFNLIGDLLRKHYSENLNGRLVRLGNRIDINFVDKKNGVKYAYSIFNPMDQKTYIETEDHIRCNNGTLIRTKSISETLSKSLGNAKESLKELNESIKMLEKNTDKFKTLTQGDLTTSSETKEMMGARPGKDFSLRGDEKLNIIMSPPDLKGKLIEKAKEVFNIDVGQISIMSSPHMKDDEMYLVDTSKFPKLGDWLEHPDNGIFNSVVKTETKKIDGKWKNVIVPPGQPDKEIKKDG